MLAWASMSVVQFKKKVEVAIGWARPGPAVPAGGMDRGSKRQRRGRVLGPLGAAGKVGPMHGRRFSLSNCIDGDPFLQDQNRSLLYFYCWLSFPPGAGATFYTAVALHEFCF